MRRREFVTLLGGATMVWPLAARAQQPAISVVGFLSSRSPSESAEVIMSFRRGLQEKGFVEGQNVVIAFRWAEGAYNRLPSLADELVALRIAGPFAAGGQPSALAAKAATSTVPVVFSAVNDPDRLGLVASFNRPGGNVTGMSMSVAGVGGKNVELLHQLVPTAGVLAYLVNPSNPTAEIYSREAKTAADALGIKVRVLNASTEEDLNDAFAALTELKAGGLVVIGEPFFDAKRERIVSLAAQHASPAIYTFREYVWAGGGMSYGASIADNYYRAGS